MTGGLLKITAFLLCLAVYLPTFYVRAHPLPPYFKSPVSYHWNSQRGYKPWQHATPRGIEIINNTHAPMTDSCCVSMPSDGFTLSFRTSSGGDSKRLKASWGFFISTPDAPDIWATMEHLSETETTLHGSLRISIYTGTDSIPVASSTVSEGFNLYGGDNLWVLRKDGNTLRLGGGNRYISEFLSTSLPKIPRMGRDDRTGTLGFTISPNSKILISDISIIPEASTVTPEMTHWKDTGKLEKHLSKSRNRIEGYWTMGSRTLEESKLRMGGDYRLAIVYDKGRYFLIYLGGATKNQGLWSPGAIKGVLTPRGSDNSFDVEWVDASGLVMSHDITAIAEGDDSITIYFPYQQSNLQLLKSHQ